MKDKIIIRDFSESGVYVNSKRVELSKELLSNDIIQFGEISTSWKFIVNKFDENNSLNDENSVFLGDNKISLVNSDIFKAKDNIRNHLSSKINNRKFEEDKNYNKNNERSFINSNIKNELNEDSLEENQNIKKYNNKENELSDYQKDINIDRDDLTAFNKKFQNINSKGNSKGINNLESHMTFNSKDMPNNNIQDKDLKKENNDLNKQINKKVDKNDLKLLYEENEELKSQISYLTQTLKKNENNLTQVIEEYTNLSIKNNAVMIHASALQKRLDELEIEKQQYSSELEYLKNNDWGKIITEKDVIISALEKDLNYYKKELNSLRTTNSEFKDNRIQSLLDNYLEENKKLTKSIEDYQNKELLCNKKWGEVLKENESLKEKVNIISSELENQVNIFNNQIEDYDKKVLKIMTTFPLLLEENDPKKASAAHYLVEQINYFMEERRKENVMKLELNDELNCLSLEKEALIKHINYLEKTINNLCEDKSIKKMKERIDELEDLLIQQNNTVSPSKITNLEECIISLENKKTLAEEQLKLMSFKLKEYMDKGNLIIFDEKSTIINLSKALREKDSLILSLKKQVNEMFHNKDKFKGMFNDNNININSNNLNDIIDYDIDGKIFVKIKIMSINNI